MIYGNLQWIDLLKIYTEKYFTYIYTSSVLEFKDHNLLCSGSTYTYTRTHPVVSLFLATFTISYCFGESLKLNPLRAIQNKTNKQSFNHFSDNSAEPTSSLLRKTLAILGSIASHRMLLSDES